METHQSIQKDIYVQGSLNIACSIKSIGENAMFIDREVFIQNMIQLDCKIFSKL